VTRGERNNNPGNIREGFNDKTAWLGERATNDDPDFEEFTTPEYGIRALAKLLLGYQRRHGLKTVREILTRWAPASENNTEAYIDAVCREINVSPDIEILLESPTMLQLLVRAIIHHENGRVVYAREQIERGVSLALAAT
jgi:hypothetical protein